MRIIFFSRPWPLRVAYLIQRDSGTGPAPVFRRFALLFFLLNFLIIFLTVGIEPCHVGVSSLQRRTAAVFYHLVPSNCVVICGRQVSRLQLHHYHRKFRAWEVGPISEMANVCGPDVRWASHVFTDNKCCQPTSSLLYRMVRLTRCAPVVPRVLGSSVLRLHLVLRATHTALTF